MFKVTFKGKEQPFSSSLLSVGFVHKVYGFRNWFFEVV